MSDAERLDDLNAEETVSPIASAAVAPVVAAKVKAKAKAKPKAAAKPAKPARVATPAPAFEPEPEPVIGRTEPLPAAGFQKGDPLADWQAVERVAAALKVGADRNRIRILACISDTEVCAGDIAKVIGCSQAATSHHLALMRHTDLVKFSREGKQNFYTATVTGKLLATLARNFVSAPTL